jgi:thiol-disulfide isomerase/thioredoxin
MRFLPFVFLAFLFLPQIVFAQEAKPLKLYTLSSEQILEHIHSKKSRKVVLFYTSWCPYCREAVPAFIDLARSKKGSVIAISTDQDPDALVKYVQEIGSLPFPLIRAKDNNLYDAMRQIGIDSTGSIPYMAVLDENEKVVTQGTADASKVALYFATGKVNQFKQTD